MLKEGDKIPAFSVIDQDGKAFTSEDLTGQRTVLYFYPKDSTPGCTAEACNLRDNIEALTAAGYRVIGVSKDSVASHGKFAVKYDLPFILLSDPELQAIQAYDVWHEKKMCGKVSMGVVRTTYVIDENGVIEWAREKVKPDTNAEEILAYLG